MRRHDDVRQPEDGQRGVGRLVRKHIQTRSPEAAVHQRAVERRFVHEPAPRHIDEAGGGLHHGDAPGIDQMPRLVGQVDVEREVIALGHDVIELVRGAHELRPDLVKDRLIDGTNVDRHDAHAEGPGPPRQFHSAAAEPDDAQRLAAQLPAGRDVGHARPEVGLALAQPMRQTEDEQHGVLAERRCAERARAVRQHHPGGLDRIDGDVVQPGRLGLHVAHARAIGQTDLFPGRLSADVDDRLDALELGGGRFGPVKDSHLVMTAARFDHVAPPRRPQVRQGVRKDQHVQPAHAAYLLISATLAIRVLHPLVMRNSSPPSRRPAYPRSSVSVSALGASWSP